MISFEQALQTVLGNAVPTGAERVALGDSLNRVLAEEIRSDMDMPPFDKSAVDGFACRMADLKTPSGEAAWLEVTDTIPAGKEPKSEVGPGQCARIMTGAMVPAGADCVIMVEETEEDDRARIRFTRDRTAVNICYRAEDILAGEVVLTPGMVITPAHIAVLASVGAVNPLAARLPRVAVIATGNELVEPEVKPGPSSIRNSNAAQLQAQLKQVPATPLYLGIADDDQPALRAIIGEALTCSDVILLSGGVSMGDFDYVPGILDESGFTQLFKSVAIQPGRPTLFGRKENQFVFGLPGNPVSSFVLFELMVKPFLMKMMGAELMDPAIRLPMGVDFKRKKSGRKSLLPVVIRQGEIFPVEYHGSAHINAYTVANATITIAIGITEVRKGEMVDVRPL
jgi:molybdopterin molybdotransferase